MKKTNVPRETPAKQRSVAVEARPLATGERHRSLEDEAAAGNGEGKAPEPCAGLEQQLRDEIAKRMRAEQRFDELLEMVSHQLRNPLAGILGVTELILGRHHPPEEQRRFVEMIHHESRHLADLVSDLFDVGALESGQVRYDFQRVSLEPLLKETAARFADRDPRHVLKVEIENELPEIHADRCRLQQALDHLLSNALESSPRGSEVRLRGRLEDVAVVVSIHDRGAGIPQDDLERIFDKCFRARNAPDMARKSGLGLAIARHVVRDHGGEIRVASELGVGSTFSVVLPLVPRR